MLVDLNKIELEPRVLVSWMNELEEKECFLVINEVKKDKVEKNCTRFPFLEIIDDSEFQICHFAEDDVLKILGFNFLTLTIWIAGKWEQNLK